ncbi:uncharacterized protein LOC111909149 isoform X1 [Lactuca sativa]|uniref:uncharacterized protein LOC111909149 isoform X1 n=1 Tax=Lactuca sativa TaxID=4236 RepID=UPI000CD97B21|nr:uncharacterized protein LOC111909149 isoform X1 [Lactuca sativa]
MSINMLPRGFVFNNESNCQTSGFKKFRIREYVAAVRERDPRTCWPFGSVCEFKDLNTQDVAPKTLPLSNLKITEDTNASKLPKVQSSKGKEVVEFEAPTAFEVEVSKNNEAGSETVTAFELEWTKENNTESEIATAMTLLEISKGNKTQLETSTEFELEIPKEKMTQSENASAFELEWTKGIETGYESETATEIITSKELNNGMDEDMSDGGTELVNLSESENEEIVKEYGGSNTEIVVISDDDDDDDANLGKTSKPTKKRKCRGMSELMRDPVGPDIESTLHLSDSVDEYTDESDEDFTIDDYDDKDDSDDDETEWMLLKKQKAVKITSRSNRSRNYKKKKTCAPKPKPKPSNRGPKGRTKRAKLHPHPQPHNNFAARKLAVAIEAEVALAANQKRSGLYDMRGGTGQTVVGQPVAGVGGLKDPGPVVTGTPGKQWTLVCLLNRNPADFTIIGPGNKYMTWF